MLECCKDRKFDLLTRFAFVITFILLNTVMTPRAEAAVPPAKVVQAHEWSSQSGSVSIENGVAPDGTSITNMAAGDWAMYAGIDFGDGSYDQLMATLSSDESGKTIEVRVDSPTGSLIGTLGVHQTVNRHIFREEYTDIPSITGVHDVYLVFPDAIAASVNWFVLGKNSANESAADFTSRMQWFTEARFGNFPVWGPYSVLGGEYNGTRGAEWIMNIAKIPKADYIQVAAKPLSESLSTSAFNAKDWVDLTKQAGQKYMVVTSKFHDGFSMFKTNVNDFKGYDIVSLGQSGRDPIQELAEESKRQGIKFGVYYSILDWANPNADGFVDSNDSTLTPNRALYVTQMKEQLRELIENYDVDLIWFDGGWYKWWSPEIGADIYNYLRTLKHDIIVNNRLEHGNGDYGTPEQNIPSTGLGQPWETCMTINGKWGYAPYDTNWKTPAELIGNLAGIASKDGNYLLSMGPRGDGSIPQESIDRLYAMGAWLNVNGDSIYGTGPNVLLDDTTWGYSTTESGRLYLHVLNWPVNGKLRIPNMSNVIQQIYPMSDPQTALPYQVENGEIIITLPQLMPDPNDSVIVVDVVGDPAPAQFMNLALNKTATASSSWYNSPDYSASKAIDGDKNTRWAAGPNTTNAWLEVDLGTATTFNRVKVNEFESRISSYTIQYWNGSAWVDAYSGATIGGVKSIAFQPVTGSKIRLNVLASTDVPSFYEFGVYNTLTDYAENKPANASSTWYNMPAYSASKATDGDSSTRWAGGAATTSNWLEVDLGVNTTFNQVMINEFESRITGYAIQYWNGSAWLDASTGTTIGANKHLSFSPVTGSKVRLNITSAMNVPSIYEFRVYHLE